MIPHEPRRAEVEGLQNELAKALAQLGRRRFFLSDARVLADRLDRIEAIYQQTIAAYSKGKRRLEQRLSRFETFSLRFIGFWVSAGTAAGCGVPAAPHGEPNAVRCRGIGLAML